MEAVIILCIIYCLYKIFKSNQPASLENNESSGDALSETQRNWRKMKQEQELDSLLIRDSDFSDNMENLVNLQKEMNAYLLEHQRPFVFGEYLTHSIDRRIFGYYLKHLLIACSVFFIFGIGGWGTLLTIGFCSNILFIDFLVYRRQLALEVTEWNPEFQKKFVKKFDDFTFG